MGGGGGGGGGGRARNIFPHRSVSKSPLEVSQLRNPDKPD